jgi:hypothetical protein
VVLHFPNVTWSLSVLRRSVLVWLGIRAALFVKYGREPLSLLAIVLIVTLSVALVLYDLRRSGEKLFLANLGVPTSSLGALAAAPPLCLEFVLDVLVL